MKTLILTEKPSVARDFSSALANAGKAKKAEDGYIETDDFIITWAIGHLLSPFDPEDYDAKFKRWNLSTLPILPDDFKFKAQPKTKKQLDVIKRLLKRSDIKSVIVATDAGREGELIARLILNEAKSRHSAQRFFTSAALTPEVIHHELKNVKPLYEFDRLYIAGRARQRADWLVGMNLSRLATLKLNDLFSVGRVQTAVLGLLVERRKSIDSFVPKDYFELKGQFRFKSGELKAYWFDPDKKEEEKRQDQRSFFDDLCPKIKNKPAQVIELKETQKTKYPEGLYSLTELQRVANMQFGFSASKTLEIAQGLYEKYKCLSYPRTDSKVMAESSFDLVRSLVYKFKDLYPEKFEKFEAQKLSLKNKIVFDNNRLTDHHGLIPLKNFSGDKDSPEGKIFHLVLSRFISNFLANHIYLETNVIVSCEGEVFKTQGKKIIEMGFKILEGRENEDLLPALTKGEIGQLKETEVEAKKTKPPFEYTEASLLYDMTNPARLVSESDHKKIFRSEIGLGTQATRAQIIETLLKRQYVERKAKNLIATAKGIHLIEHLERLPAVSQLVSVAQTAKLELNLEAMAQGERDDLEFLDNIISYVKLATDEWKKSEGGALPRSSENIERKENAADKIKVSELGACPLCQAKIMDFPKSYSCSRWKEGCQFTIWKIMAKKKLSQSIIKTLMNKKKTELLKGFKSKTGKNFSAYLELNAQGKVNFLFEERSK